MTSPIEEFLVKLGFGVDQPALRRFETALKDAGSAVEFRTSGIARDLVKWQVGIVSGFGAISVAVVGMADKVAMADQQFRLFGERMFMAQPEAKKLQIALDALGASLGDVANDPELNQRFQQLIEDQDTLQKKLGGNFERNMIGIRNLRFEFTRLEVSLKYLAEGFISRLFERLGFSIDDAQGKLQDLVDWMTNHLPEIADKIADHLLPVLKQFWVMLKEIGSGLEELGVVFTNFVGLLAGDNSLEGTTFSLQKFGHAVKDVSEFMAQFVHWMVVAEKLLAHLADAAVLLAGGHFADMSKELKAAFGDFTKQTGSLFGIPLGSMLGGAAGTAFGAQLGEALGGVIGTAFGPGIGTAIGVGVGGAVGTGIGALAGGEFGGELGALKQKLYPQSTSTDLKYAQEGKEIASGKPVGTDLIAAMAKKFNVDPFLALAVAKTESGFRQYKNGKVLESDHKARGVMQLEPATARSLGVNPDNTEENVQGGVRLLGQLLTKYHGDLATALGAYNEGEPKIDARLRQGLAFTPEVQKYIADVESAMRKYQENAGAAVSNGYAGDVYHQAGDVYHGDTNVQSGDVSVGDVHVHVNQPSASVDDVQKAAMKGVMDAISYQTQRDLTNFASAY